MIATSKQDGRKLHRFSGQLQAFPRSNFKTSRPALRCLAAALAATVLVCGLLILNNDYRGPDDDLGISIVLSGLYPDGGQCLFTNAVLNGIIYQLNIAIPELNWFLVIERLAVTVAFFSFCYILLRHAPLGLSLACIGFVAYFIMPKCTLGSNFTVVAALCVATGELCCCSGIMRGAPSSCVAGTILVTLGFMWRALVLLLSAPFLALAFAGLLVRLGRGRFQRTKALVVRALVCMIAVGLCVGGALAFDKAVWAEPKWADWLEYNDARYALVDYPMSDYDEVRDELASIGISESDYWLMRNWITADPDYITSDLLMEVSDIAREPVADRSLSAAFLAEGRHLVKSPLLTVSLTCIAACALLLGRKRVLATVVLSLGGAFAACVLFRYTGRLPARVEYSTWLLSLLPILVAFLAMRPPALVATRSVGDRRIKASALIGMMFALLCIVGLMLKWASSFNVERIDQFEKSSAFVESNDLVQRFTEPGVVYVWDTTTFTQLEKQLKYRHLPPASFMGSTTFMGGWTQGSPLVRAHNAEIGIPNPIRGLIDRPDTYFVTRRKEAIEQLTRYLREHYSKDAKAEVVDEVPLGEKGADPLLVVRFYAD